MRVLVVHNRYSSRVPSGENLAVDDEVRWLREAGVEVARHEVSNDEVIGSGLAAHARRGIDAAWSLPARRGIVAALDQHRPDLVHVHNLFPLLTASVPSAAWTRGLPVVWSVHNFRVTCVAGTHFRDGRRCTDCRPGWRLPGIVHGCFAESPVASLLVTGATAAYRALARRRDVTAVAISGVVARWLVDEAGFDAARVRVKENGVPSPAGPVPPPEHQGRFAYVGRLAAEKGVELLLDAWARTSTTAALDLVGDGPARVAVAAAAAGDPRVHDVGPVAPAEVAGHIDAARAVIVPSVWDEPFGRVAAEAMARGRPVITTGRGGLAEVVGDSAGWITGDDPVALARAIDEAAAADDMVAARGDAAGRRHAARFSPEATTAALVEIYDEAVARTGRRGAGSG
jgi:glycosyltransferase involved in cell wall biosynthesis